MSAPPTWDQSQAFSDEDDGYDGSRLPRSRHAQDQGETMARSAVPAQRGVTEVVGSTRSMTGGVVTASAWASGESSNPVLVFFRRVGRVLRFVAGVDEAVMDRVRYLRAWYASLGAVVLLVGTIAACSMWFAVQQATSVHPIQAIPPAIVWFLFIVVMDRWIVSSRANEAWQRFILLVTRATLAILFGVVIAEPLVLRVFENQIVQEVEKQRSENLSQIEAAYLSCNPDPVTDRPASEPAEGTLTSSQCLAGGYDLGIAAALAGLNSELATARAQFDQLSSRINANRQHQDQLRLDVLDECAGVARPGTTGRYGEGINCQRNQKYLAKFEASVNWAQDESDLVALRDKVASLRASVTEGQESFTATRAAAISARLADQPQVGEDIGLLQRMEVLHRMGNANFTLFVGVWLVRLLFIAIDTSPVLMKIASGRTPYDRWVDDSLGHVVQTHEDKLKHRRESTQLDQDVQKQVHKRQAEEHARRLRDEEIAAREQEYLRGE